MTFPKKTNKVDLRQQAEATLSKRKKSLITETDTLRLVHELEVHQIELEMQNEELARARGEMKTLLDQYTDLYDFAPVGYFTLAHDGIITQVNLTGASLLGAERGKLLKRRFGLFVDPQSRPAFTAFLEKVFDGDEKETCEVKLLKEKAESFWAQIEAVRDDQMCRVIVSDITERKLAGENLRLRMAEIEALHEQLREQAIRDPITGLFNRRYLQETLDREIARAQRENKPVGIIMIDIDHFKQVNDTYGHKAGDLTLENLGRLINENLRASDIPCRYGGEEFIIVVLSALLAATLERAQLLQEKINNMRVFYEGCEISITASMGVATYPLQGSKGEEVLIHADKALYQAKQNGRNCICKAEFLD
jgi:diguanylate cyclase (GGDEF)-like protein/PAS domain S-box-containing protein